MTNSAFTVSGGSGGGTVVSVAAVSANTDALTITGSPVVQSGTLTFTSIGNLISQTILTSGTAATYTVPAGINKIIVECTGGGGGGGGATGGVGFVSAGGGGGGGGYCKKLISTTPGSNFIYTVGTGGAGGAIGGNGVAGINTTFDTMTAGAGTAGGGGALSNTGFTVAVGNASSGGNATGGDINVIGEPGFTAFNFQTSTISNGVGGSSFYGKGGDNVTLNVTGSIAGIAGSGYGGGGSGALQFNTVGAAGGAGSNGSIIITEFS